MKALRLATAAVTVAAVVFVPVAVATAAPGGSPGSPHPKPTVTAPTTPVAKPPVKPKFVVTALTLGGRATYDLKAGPLSLPVRIQVKDFDRKYDVTSVTVGVSLAGATVAPGKLVGHSPVVSNWRTSVAIPVTAIPAGTTTPVRVCLTNVTVLGPAGAVLAPVVAPAAGLKGRDCVLVVNTTGLPTAPSTPSTPVS